MLGAGIDVEWDRTQTKEIVASPPGFQSPSSVPFWKNLAASQLPKQVWFVEQDKANYRKAGLEQRNNS
jgi:hypothetical protein